MFEKEAEDNKPPYAYCALDTKCELWKDGFQKGAGFGYNRGKEELEKENKELKCFIRDLIYENYNCCFLFNNTTCLFNSDYRNRAEELIGEKL